MKEAKAYKEKEDMAETVTLLNRGKVFNFFFYLVFLQGGSLQPLTSTQRTAGRSSSSGELGAIWENTKTFR